MKHLGDAIQELVTTLLSRTSAVQSETSEYFRVDQATISNESVLRQIVSINKELLAAGLGSVSLFGEVAGEFDLNAVSFAEIDQEILSIIFNKSAVEQSVFVTSTGFLSALQAGLKMREVVWVALDFAPFSTFAMLVTPWGGPTGKEAPDQGDLLSPRKLVRDHTHRKTPSAIDPWLLARPPERSSALFVDWQRIAVERLSFCLPFEIVGDPVEQQIVLKGPRSQSIVVSSIKEPNPTLFDLLTEAATWVYCGSRDAETRFTVLNYHLSLDWKSGAVWPDGLRVVLPASLVAAKEAFAFHLQDKSKDALKSLADLRKSLQDDVTKTQQASRELVSTLWRDFAIAAGVLALRYLPGAANIPPVWLKIVTLSSAALLLISIVLALWSNYRFNSSAKKTREDWRTRIYGFIDIQEWQKLVDKPLSQALATYRCVAGVVAIMYVGIISYLVHLSGVDLCGTIEKLKGLIWP